MGFTLIQWLAELTIPQFGTRIRSGADSYISKDRSELFRSRDKLKRKSDMVPINK